MTDYRGFHRWSSPATRICGSTGSPQPTHDIPKTFERILAPRCQFFDCAHTPFIGTTQGLYGEGFVEEFHSADLEAVLPSIERWLSWRDAGRKTPRPRRPDRVDGDSPFRFYRVNAATLYALHPDGHPEHGTRAEWRVPVDLTESFSRAYQARLA